jgi:hypothetical protein
MSFEIIEIEANFCLDLRNKTLIRKSLINEGIESIQVLNRPIQRMSVINCNTLEGFAAFAIYTLRGALPDQRNKGPKRHQFTIEFFSFIRTDTNIKIDDIPSSIIRLSNDAKKVKIDSLEQMFCNGITAQSGSLTADQLKKIVLTIPTTSDGFHLSFMAPG